MLLLQNLLIHLHYLHEEDEGLLENHLGDRLVDLLEGLLEDLLDMLDHH